MPDTIILLKVLLKQKHLQGHRAFCKEYDRIAKKIDPDLIGGFPSKAQFYRWLSGELVSLPYADHCRILESMFPSWTAEQLFQPYGGSLDFVPEPTGTPALAAQPSTQPASISGGVADIVAAYTNRSDFIHELPPRKLFDGAQDIRLAGLSLNLLCQNYPDRSLLALLESGAKVRCLFLDPDGKNMAQREIEENEPPGHLAILTRLNIEALRRLKSKLTPECRANLHIRTYDEPIRFNITIIDSSKSVVQFYLPEFRGLESPTLVLEAGRGSNGIFHTFESVFEGIWERSSVGDAP